jgi:ATP-dependent RNA helicase RhlE
MIFSELRLIDPLLRAVAAEGYHTPTPIQAQAIPLVLDGRDVCGVAQTGTGKTAAFALPILQLLSARPRSQNVRVLILAPTRELASQIGESFTVYGKNLHLRNTVIFGGVGQEPQVAAVRRGVDVLVATPGRLLDLLQQRLVSLAHVEILVLDEADRMLDMGFIHDVKRIIAAVPRKRQTLFFSATMPDEVVALSKSILTDPARVEVTPPATTVERIEQYVFHVEKSDKPRLLRHLLADKAMARVLVFTRTKHGANKVVKELVRNQISAEPIHGNKSQSARERALAGFKSGDVRVLVATDIAARGIDVDGISHVVNYELPNITDTYVHRIGRTARAGSAGIALSFCDSEERTFLRDIERAIRKTLARVEVKVPASIQAAPEQPRPPRPHHNAHGHGRAPASSQQHRAPQRSSGRDLQSQPRPQGQAPAQGGRPQHPHAAPRPAAQPFSGRGRRRSFGSIPR